MEGVDFPKVNKEEDQGQGQEAFTVSAEMLLAQIVQAVGEEFVIIPTSGWQKIVTTIQDYSKSAQNSLTNDEDLLKILEGLGIPVIPVSLAPKQEESLIIMPNDTPKGESKIIIP